MSLISLYYAVKPMLPRSVQLALRRAILRYRLPMLRDVWPVNKSAAKLPHQWCGWPDGKQFAFVLTHDVESLRGLSRCLKLAELDRSYGFKSAFNIVPFKYDVPDSIRNWLTDNGFEVGVHDYNHDGKLYNSQKTFERRAVSINKRLKEWNSQGFRSGAMHHKLEWLSTLNINYDCSTFDTDPFEPQSDGVNTIFPFWYQNEKTGRGFVEIPYTLPQDFTLFVIKREKNCNIWKEKLKWIAENGGAATVIVHPDYIDFGDNGKKRVDEYALEIYEEFLEHIRINYMGVYWNPLPCELAAYYKECANRAIPDESDISLERSSGSCSIKKKQIKQ